MSYRPLSATLPAGIMRQFTGATIPDGYLLCDGAAVSRATYAALFAAISTTWGSGDGSTTFNVPNMARRTPVGSGGSGTGTLGNAVGNTGGVETHTLSTAELPSHTHSATDPGHLHGQTCATSASGGGRLVGVSQSGSGSQSETGFTGGNTTGILIGNTGSGNAHNNIQPSAIVKFIIKT